MSKVSELLQSKDIELRIVAGETLALLYELAREKDEVGLDWTPYVSVLVAL